MRPVLNIAKALSDAHRVRALLALRGGELCVCQIVELLGLANSTVSKHLSVLREAGLVEARKMGRWMFYRLPGEAEAAPPVRAALRWLQDCLAGDCSALADAARLDEIVRMDPEELCRKQCAR